MNQNQRRECGRNSAAMRRLMSRADYMAEADGAAALDNFEHPEQENFDSEDIGNFVVIEFLIGTGGIMRKQGMLYFVGRSFVTLYDEAANNFIICDIFSIKFVYFYMPNDRPRYNYNLLPGTGSANMHR